MATLIEEEWKPIIGFESSYEISDNGKIRSLDRIFTRKNGKIQSVKGIIRKTWISPNGYEFCNLSFEGKIRMISVHTTVLRAFVSERPINYVANHKNGNRKDNRVQNLEWITQSKNLIHAKEVLKKNWGQKGESNSQAKLTMEQVQYIKNNPNNMNVMTLAKKFNVSHSLISMIRNNKRW